MPSKFIEKYFRMDTLPHIWCPGCGHGTITRSIAKAIENKGLDKDKVVIVSGIGCSSRAAGYLDFDTIHTTHGRAIAFATGVKLSNPDLHVIVITGDGDATAIGGNHLIHGCRRNIDITTIVYNNFIYGMTGGQYSPTTPKNSKATTAPYGNFDNTFDIVDLAIGAGASYVARGTAYHTQQLIKYIEKAIENKGFSVVDATATCYTYYGRNNKTPSPVDMMKLLKDNAITIKDAEGLTEEQRAGKIVMGEFRNNPKPEFCSEYQKLIDSL